MACASGKKKLLVDTVVELSILQYMAHHISPEYLAETLNYDPLTGLLTWKERPASHFKSGKKSAEHQAAIWNAKFQGKTAFLQVGNHGYNTSTLSGKRLSAHRVSWAIYHGAWPDAEIDHINGIKTDNRIENLRSVTRSENMRNISVKSGSMRGIIYYKPTKKWCARIHVNGKSVHLGYHSSLKCAIEARRAAEIKYGFHINHGRKE